MQPSPTKKRTLWLILIRIYDHWMIYQREEGRQEYGTQDAAYRDAEKLGAKRDSHNRPVYGEVKVIEI